MAKVHATEKRNENGKHDYTAVDTKTSQMAKKTLATKTSRCLSIRQWSMEKIITTLCLFSEMIVWGMYVGVMNSSMLDLELVTGASTAQISLLWTSTTVGAGIMAPIAGFLLDKADSRLYLGLAQLGAGAFTACMPLAGNFMRIMILAVCNGIFLGLLDIGRNITAVKLWGWDGAMWLQFYHFIFAVGSAASPLFTKPFLAFPLQNLNETAGNINGADDIYSSTTAPNVTTESVIMSDSRVHFAFAIVGGLFVFSGIMCIIAFFILRSIKRQDNATNKKEQLQVSTRKQSKQYVVLMVFLLFFRFFFIVGVEVTIGALHMTFLVKGLGWTKSDAVMAVFTLRVAFAAMRGLGVGLAVFITPTKLMFMDIALLVLSFSLMWISGFVPEATWLIWVGTGIVGAGCATFYSASMSWAEKYLQISGRLGGFFLLGSTCAVLSFPALAGHLFDNYTPWAFVYVCMGGTVMLFVVTIVSTAVGQRHRKRHPGETNIEIPELTSNLTVT